MNYDQVRKKAWEAINAARAARGTDEEIMNEDAKLLHFSNKKDLLEFLLTD